MTLNTTTTDAPKRQTLKELVQERVIDAPKATFDKWLAKTEWTVSNRQVATTMLSTYIEERVKAREGVYFTNPETVNIIIRNATTGEAKALKINVPSWMTDFILSFPNAPWARG